jgi:anti-sigma factor RsiW
MECEKASVLMMKYMDKTLSAQEAEALNRHIASCSACKEDIMVYDKIMSDFSEMELVEPPENFTASVMAKIRLLPAPSSAADGMLGGVWAVFSVLMGLGFLLAMNKDGIMAWMAQYPQLSAALVYMQPLSESVSQISNAAITSLQTAFTQASSWMSSLRYGLLGIFSVLAIAQILMRRKERGKVEAK